MAQKDAQQNAERVNTVAEIAVHDTDVDEMTAEGARSRGAKSLYPLMRLAPFLKRYPSMLALSLFALLIAALATLALPFAIRQVVDLGFVSAGGDGHIDRYFQYLLAIVFVLAVGSALRFYCVYWLAERLIADLKSDVFAKLMSLSAGFYDRAHSGEMMSRLAADTTLINTAIRASVSQALRNFLVMAGGLIMMIVSSPALSLMVILAIPVIVLPLMFYGRIVRRLSKDAQDVLAGLNQYGSEALSNVRLVQAFGAEKHMKQRFEAGNEEAVDASLLRTRARAMLTAVAIFLVMASIVLILWYGAHDVANGSMSPGALVQFMLYAVFAGGSMGSLTEVWGEVAQAAGAAERLSDYLDAEPEVKELQKPALLSRPVNGEITFENVSFAYPTRPDETVLEGVSFHINPGERVAIVGASGAGKSTLYQLLLRFYDPVQGRILIDGVGIETLTLADLRACFALVPQEPNLFDASIEENIAFADGGADRADVMAAAKAAQADEFISQFSKGYETIVGEGGQGLSGGQRQRIALARAILSDAPILLLDEATSALDTGSEDKVQQALLKIMEGRTSLIIAHRLSTVRDADRILVFDKGRFVEEGRHNELVEKGGLYAALQRTQLLNDGASVEPVA